MQLVHPTSSILCAVRDRLLQHTLREPKSPYPIASEYPLLLGVDAAQFSYCLMDGEQVVAHANLWPRQLTDQVTKRNVSIGFVGNVATDADRRGEGLMRRLMDELKSEAAKAGLEALVLWSDLLEFYQKLGFQSYGTERRYIYRTAWLADASPWRHVVKPDAALLEQLLKLRLAVPATVARSAAEFQALLSIPATNLYVLRGGEGYVVMGKGMDMINVVHEWGGPTPDAVLDGLAFAATSRGYGESMLLAPASLPDAWHQGFARQAKDTETHAMAIAWTPDNAQSARDSLARAFIWGLDSI